MTRPRRRLLWLTIGTAAVVGVLAAALQTGDDDGDGAPGGGPQPGMLPLLGTTGDVPQRAALGIKIDATDPGRPQAGLHQADVVVEEVVEGGLTRLLALFQSQDPATVGPVRSARSTDLAVLDELGRPLFAFSGANETFRALVEADDSVDVDAAVVPDAYRRDEARRAPYNLFADPAALRATGAEIDAEAAATPPLPLFEYRAEGAPLAGAGVRATSGLRSAMLATAVDWTWNAQQRVWERTQDGTPHVDADGERVTAVNVVVRITPYVDSGVRDSRGAVVPEAQTVGEGDAWLLSDGRAQPGHWQKVGADALTSYTDSEGMALRLTPGTTWIELLPAGAVEVLP